MLSDKPRLGIVNITSFDTNFTDVNVGNLKCLATKVLVGPLPKDDDNQQIRNSYSSSSNNYHLVLKEERCEPEMIDEGWNSVSDETIGIRKMEGKNARVKA